MNLDLIIPTHNRAGLLIKCLDSVFAAKIPSGLNVTVYVIDNNSTDTTKYVADYFVEDYGIRYLFVDRAGKSAALNAALAQTSGDLVGFIDDDEQIDPSWFEVVYREFSGNPKIDFIGGPYAPLWETDPPRWIPNSYAGAIGVEPSPDTEIRPLTRQQYIYGKSPMLMGGNSVIRRSILEQVLPYPENLGKIGKKIRSGEDEVIYHRLLDRGGYGIVVPELKVLHWIPSARLTKQYYRRWVIGRGISQGYQFHTRPIDETSIFGIPGNKIRVAVRSLLKILHYSPRIRFTAQLDILDCLSTMYGFHFGEDAHPN